MVFVEKSVANSPVNEKFQLLRHGFFNVDNDSTKDLLVLNEIVPLKKSY